MLITKTGKISRMYIASFVSQVKNLKLCEQQEEDLSTRETWCDQYFLKINQVSELM